MAPVLDSGGGNPLSSVLIEPQITTGNQHLERSARHDSTVNTATNDFIRGGTGVDLLRFSTAGS